MAVESDEDEDDVEDQVTEQGKPTNLLFDLEALALGDIERAMLNPDVPKPDTGSVARVLGSLVADKVLQENFDAWLLEWRNGQRDSPVAQTRDIQDLVRLLERCGDKAFEADLFRWVSGHVERQRGLKKLPYTLEALRPEKVSYLTVRITKDPPMDVVFVPLIALVEGLDDTALILKPTHRERNGEKVYKTFTDSEKFHIICKKSNGAFRPVVFSLFVDATRVCFGCFCRVSEQYLEVVKHGSREVHPIMFALLNHPNGGRYVVIAYVPIFADTVLKACGYKDVACPLFRLGVFQKCLQVVLMYGGMMANSPSVHLKSGVLGRV